MDRNPQSPDGARKGIDAGPRPAQRGAPGVALGQGRQDLCLRGAGRKQDAGRFVRRTQPTRGAAFHVRARLERRLQELLVLGRSIRPHGAASGRARHHAGGDFARAVGKLEAFKARMGWSFDWFSSADTDFNHDYAVSFRPDEIKSGAKIYNFGTSGFGVEEAA